MDLLKLISKKGEPEEWFDTTALKTAFEEVLWGVYFKDEQRVYRYANAVCAEDLELGCADILGKSDVDLIKDQATITALAELEKRVLETREPIDAERLQRHLRGENGATIELSCLPVATTSGTWGLLGIYRDVTADAAEEETKAESASRFESLFNQARTGILVLGEDDRVKQANVMVTQLLGHTPGNLLGQSIVDLTPVDQVASVRSNIKQVSAFGYLEFECDLLGKNGEAFPAEIAAGSIEYEGEQAVQMIVRDRSVAQLLRQEADAERQQLSLELKDVKDGLSAANAEVQRANRLTDEFLSGMSHELRTPLNAVLGLTEALQEEVYGSVNDTQKSTLIEVADEGRRLLSLINDVLDMAKAGIGKLELESAPINIPEVCRASLERVKRSASEKEIELDCKIDPKVQIINADERRVHQILTNLLENAVKFTPEKGTVLLEVIPDRDENTVHFAVSDTGIGIAKDQLDDLFKPFRQLDSSLTREHEGAGLGLTLVYRLTEMHGGSVSVESEPGSGSRFLVSLPADEMNDKETGSQGTIDQAVVVNSALVIEDCSASAEQICRYLQERGIRPKVCSRGDEAMQLALDINPDLIVLDIELPGLHGWEVLERLQANRRTSKIPVIISSIVDEKQRGIALGASEYLVKPINRNQLGYALCKVAAACEDISKALVFEAASQDTTDDHDEDTTEQRTILLAEDNEANIKTLTDYLKVKGYVVNVARDGMEAVEQTEASPPDLILMDIQMPRMNGLEAIECIQKIDGLDRIPIIALTALAMPGDRDRCINAGASDYLSKPVSLKALNAAISKYLNQTQTLSQVIS